MTKVRCGSLRETRRSADDARAALRALRERVEPRRGVCLLARRLERVAPEKIYNWPRRFCLQLRRPRWDGDRVDRHGGRGSSTRRSGRRGGIRARPPRTELAPFVPRRRPSTRPTTAPSPMKTASGAAAKPSPEAGWRCETGGRHHRWQDAAQAFGLRHAGLRAGSSPATLLANGDPKLPAWVRDDGNHVEARRPAVPTTTTTASYHSRTGGQGGTTTTRRCTTRRARCCASASSATVATK